MQGPVAQPRATNAGLHVKTEAEVTPDTPSQGTVQRLSVHLPSCAAIIPNSRILATPHEAPYPSPITPQAPGRCPWQPPISLDLPVSTSHTHVPLVRGFCDWLLSLSCSGAIRVDRVSPPRSFLRLSYFPLCGPIFISPFISDGHLGRFHFLPIL